MGMKRKNTIIFATGTNEIISKKCGSCQEIKPISAFRGKDKTSIWSSQRYQSRCIICAKQNSKFRIKNAIQSEFLRRQREAIEYARS